MKQKSAGGAARHERRFWIEEREQFKKRFPEAAAQREVVGKIARQLIPLLNRWKKAKSNAAKTWQQFENYLLNSWQGKINPRQFRRLLDKSQKQSALAIEEELNFFQVKETLMHYLGGTTDFKVQQNAIALEYEKVAIALERAFYGNIRSLADARLLRSFAELISRMNLGKDERYKSLRQNISGLMKAGDYAERLVSEYVGELRYAYDRGNISWKKYYINVLMSELELAQQLSNIAEAEEALYNHLRNYARNEKLGRFITMLEREKRAEKNHFAKKGTSLEKEIAAIEGTY